MAKPTISRISNNDMVFKPEGIVISCTTADSARICNMLLAAGFDSLSQAQGAHLEQIPGSCR